jgi:type IV fimbrial biogenesis protein FimT
VNGHHIPARSRGYTAIELLTTMTVMGIATALAVPNFQQFMQNNRAAADANALIGALNIARNESVTRGAPVTVCASADGASCSGDDDWSSGWIVFTDANAPAGEVSAGADPDTVLRVFPALVGGTALAADTTFVAFRPNGFLGNGGAAGFDLSVEGCTGETNRRIVVNLQGRASVARIACAAEE